MRLLMVPLPRVARVAGEELALRSAVSISSLAAGGGGGGPRDERGGGGEARANSYRD